MAISIKSDGEKEIRRDELLANGWTRGAIKRFLTVLRVVAGERPVYLYDERTVEDAEGQPVVQAYLEKMKACREKAEPRVTVALPLIDAIREASWCAHRWRDAAQSHYQSGSHRLAQYARQKKEKFYELKERGIAAAYRQGLLRYAGASPQGMGIFEYGEGGKSCFHSCLHPTGIERKPVEGHPEVLEVGARQQAHNMADVEFTLAELTEPGPEFERSAPPRKRRDVKCYLCGEEGHIARECTHSYSYDGEDYCDEDDDFDEEDDWGWD